MENGWIKLHRKLLSSRIFQSEPLLQLWCYCLLRANHQDNWVSVTTGRGTTEVLIKRGQFMFGRKTTAKATRQKPSSVQDRMKKLEELGNIVINSVTHYSIVTICNWELYQDQDSESVMQPVNHPSTNRQPTVTNNNDKNVKNEKKVTTADKKERDLNLEKTFESLWKVYPRKIGKNIAYRHYKATVKTQQDYEDIWKALRNYNKTKNVVEKNTQYIQMSSTWFNQWKDWVDYDNDEPKSIYREYKGDTTTDSFSLQTGAKGD